MNYIEKELGKIYENVCVYGTKITYVPLLKLHEMHMQDKIKIWTLDNDLINKVNSIKNITKCFDMGDNEVIWLEDEYLKEKDESEKRKLNKNKILTKNDIPKITIEKLVLILIKKGIIKLDDIIS